MDEEMVWKVASPREGLMSITVLTLWGIGIVIFRSCRRGGRVEEDDMVLLFWLVLAVVGRKEDDDDEDGCWFAFEEVARGVMVR